MSDTNSSLTADTQTLLDRVSTTNSRVTEVNREIERKRSQADFQKNQLLSALRDHDSKFSTNFSELFESDPEKFSAELARVMGKLSSQLTEDNARNEKILALYEQGDYAQIRTLQGIEPETPAPAPASPTAKPAPAQPTATPPVPPSAVAPPAQPTAPALQAPAPQAPAQPAPAPAQPAPAPAPAPTTAQSAPPAPPSAPVVAPGVSTPGAVPPSPARFSMPAQAFDAQVVEDVDPESDGTPAPAQPAPAQPAPAPTAQTAPTSAPAQAPAPAFGFGMSFAPAVQANQQVAEESLATNPFVKKS